MRTRYKLKMTNYRLIYIPKWEIKGFEHYGFLNDKRLFNYKTNRFSKKVVRNYSVGFNLDGNFYTLAKMKDMTSLIDEYRKDNNNSISVIALYDYLKTAI